MLCDAEFQVTLPDHAYRTRSTNAEYAFATSMFDAPMEMVYQTIKQDTFQRFRMSEKATELARLCPHLAISPSLSDSADMQEVQRLLRTRLEQLQNEVACERVTVVSTRA